MARPSGPIDVIEMTVADATFTDLVIQMPCVGHVQLTHSQSSAHATGNLTLYLTWFSATVGGAAVAYAPAAPPSPSSFGSGAGTFNAVSMISVFGSASQLGVQGMSTRAADC